MLKISYIPQPDSKSCALACSVMIGKLFFPNITFDEIATVSDWQKGYVVWTYKFWLWIMDKGIKITEYDLIDAEAWANEGLEGLKKSASEKEFNYYLENTKDINSYSKDIKKVLAHPNFTYLRERPTFQDLEDAINAGKACEVVLDSRTLRGKEGFSLHRVVILGIGNNEVTFHDPAVEPNMKTSTDQFRKAWLEAVSEPELCIYDVDS